MFVPQKQGNKRVERAQAAGWNKPASVTPHPIQRQHKVTATLIFLRTSELRRQYINHRGEQSFIPIDQMVHCAQRSEERRVGKEC